MSSRQQIPAALYLPALTLTIVACQLHAATPAQKDLLKRVKDLPDFSWAGYHAGEKEIPDRKPTINIKDFGAVGNGKTDDTKALKAALAKAAATKGVVSLPPGRWVLNEVLKIDADGVVLKGAGSKRTTLVCPRSLSEIIKPSPGWSWSGGMIQVRPKKGASATVGVVREKAKAGATRLVLKRNEKAAPPKAGDWLELRWYNDTGKDTLLAHIFGGVVPRHRMGRELQTSKHVRVREWVRVIRADPGAIEIAQPLRIDARPEWRPTLARIPHLQEIGIEGLTFQFPKTSYPGHLKETGYNGIQFSSAVNCWVRDIVTVYADSGIFVGNCKHLTISDITCKGRTMHHPLCISWGSDNLVTRWRIEAPHVHGTTISWSSHGNVFSNGWGARLAMDAHRAASFQNLHTNVTIAHGGNACRPFRSGGGWGRGPHAAKLNVYWNMKNHFTPAGKKAETISGHNEWGRGIFVGWHGNRPLNLSPVAGAKQQVVDLNRKPAIEDLHLYQQRARLKKP